MNYELSSTQTGLVAGSSIVDVSAAVQTEVIGAPVPFDRTFVRVRTSHFPFPSASLMRL